MNKSLLISFIFLSLISTTQKQDQLQADKSKESSIELVKDCEPFKTCDVDHEYVFVENSNDMQCTNNTNAANPCINRDDNMLNLSDGITPMEENRGNVASSNPVQNEKDSVVQNEKDNVVQNNEENINQSTEENNIQNATEEDTLNKFYKDSVDNIFQEIFELAVQLVAHFLKGHMGTEISTMKNVNLALELCTNVIKNDAALKEAFGDKIQKLEETVSRFKNIFVTYDESAHGQSNDCDVNPSIKLRDAVFDRATNLIPLFAKLAAPAENPNPTESTSATEHTAVAKENTNTENPESVVVNFDISEEVGLNEIAEVIKRLNHIKEKFKKEKENMEGDTKTTKIDGLKL